MINEKINQARAELSSTAAYKILTDFFDVGSFCETDAFARSGDGFAEAAAGFGTVEGLPVYAFAQNSGISSGAMSKAQAAKLKKLYDLALKTGAPVVGFYDSMGGRLSQGSELLAGCSEVLGRAARLSGVVPQISVVLGTCLGTNALNAVSADVVIMSEQAQLSLDVTGKNADAAYNAENGSAAVIVKDTSEAVRKARELVTFLPSNNLTPAPQADSEAPSPHGCIVSSVADGGIKYKLYDSFGTAVKTRLVRVEGQVVGAVNTIGKALDDASAAKAAKFVRFCDAFSIPVITFVDCEGFESLASAAKLASAYAEATTVKIAVIKGKAIGSAYIALAGENADMVYALPRAVISPVGTEAAAFIMEPERMKVPVSEQKSVAESIALERLSAFNAAENSFVDAIVEEESLRAVIASALEMLSGKRVPTLSKKHSTV